ncbi:hypothetical protein I7I50_04579 [Histoplasma capsulatum G186AR]|uniref:Uncharacterized protein n=1 Tax=Ajellomyces capsulatus TaxID=5037 RepID=A0A8H7YM54_AJECA|nr:hypothetical protein I7I52_05488 [Histoplasma capsulatum]QSS75444.1 hypothetical protein I7I50_04579 [Histoplasma capsulatum G186AR]
MQRQEGPVCCRHQKLKPAKPADSFALNYRQLVEEVILQQCVFGSGSSRMYEVSGYSLGMSAGSHEIVSSRVEDTDRWPGFRW